MPLEVDQSVKIKQTSGDTVLALSNDQEFSIVIPARVKRKAIVSLRQRGWYGRRAILACFAAGLFLLLRQSRAQSNLIVIDQEYEGHGRDIKGVLLRHLRSAGIGISANKITFGRVGKRSGAHQVAWAVHRGKRAPDYTTTLDEFLSIL